MATLSPQGGRDPTGLVYLLHFNELYVPYEGAPAGSCAGYADGGPRGLARRLAKHGTWEGARLMLVITQAGIGWQIARLWPGTRETERRLKKQGGASRRCPVCGVKPRPGPLPRNADGRVSRSLTSDEQKDAAGLMTTAQLGEHARLRSGLVAGRLALPLDRGAVPPQRDPWAAALPADVPVLTGRLA